jgi:hypothetical protein
MKPPGKANARRQPGERVNKLANSPKLQSSARNVNASYGPPELCGWQVAPGVFWIQTTDPQFSRKLEKREDTRHVEMSGINHFRRTFELRGTWRKIRRVINRYLVSAGDQFSPDSSPAIASQIAPSITHSGQYKGGQKWAKIVV